MGDSEHHSQHPLDIVIDNILLAFRTGHLHTAKTLTVAPDGL
jgi:hypothetical protein